MIFDWGGTLTCHVVTVEETRGRWNRAARVLAPGHEAALGDLLFAADQGLSAQARSDHVSFDLDAVIDHALAALVGSGVEPGPWGDRAAAVDAYLSAWAEVIVHDAEAGDVLAGLRARGLRTGLLSNTFWPATFHEAVLHRDGLDELLTGRCYSSGLGHVKPHPAAFRAALASVGVSDPGRAVFVGDRADDDIAGAQRVGMRTIWRPDPTDPFAPPPPDPGPDATIGALSELLAIVDRWL